MSNSFDIGSKLVVFDFYESYSAKKKNKHYSRLHNYNLTVRTRIFY